MKLLLSLLVVGNLLALAWLQGWLAPLLSEGRDASRLSRQVNREQLSIEPPNLPGGAGAPAPARPAAPTSGKPPAAASLQPDPAVAVAVAAAGDARNAATAPEAKGAATAGDPKAPPPAAAIVQPLAAATLAPSGPAGSAANPAEPAPPVAIKPTGPTSPTASGASGASGGSTGPTAGSASGAPIGVTAGPAAITAIAAPGRSTPEPGGAIVVAGGAAAAAPASPIAGLRGASCIEVGPMDEGATLRLQAAIDAALPGLPMEVRRPEEPTSYWVYLPPAPTAAEAQRRLADARERGVSDVLVVSDGPFRWAVSLGVYRQEALAHARQRSLADRGIMARVAPRSPGTRSSLRVLSVPARLPDEFVRLRAGFPDAAARPCPAADGRNVVARRENG